jgi:hypothetical protein
MTNYADQAKEARDCREAAKRARKLRDVDGMYLRFAEEQERRAAELEAAMSPTAPLSLSNTTSGSIGDVSRRASARRR